MARIESNPLDPLPLYKLAWRCKLRGELGLWRAVDDAALTLPHATYEQFYNRAHAKLALNDWSGWADREARCFHPDFVNSLPKCWQEMPWTRRAWNGTESLHDKTIFIVADGGRGDCIQMARFIPAVASGAKRVIVGARPELVSLLEYNFGHLATIVDRNTDHCLPYDRYTWMMSLPALVGSLPRFLPLRAPHPNSKSRVQRRQLQVGICWAGNHRHPMDRFRSLSIDVLAPLFNRDDVRWHSLQVGDRANEAMRYDRMTDPLESSSSFSNTANLIANLNCVISVDTSVAHLAGSLGVRTLLLLNVASEFRWGGGEFTPWYPSMRYIRQRHVDDWTGVRDVLSIELDREVLEFNQ